MNSIESYINRNFIIGDNAFTNLLIAIPIIATILLMYFNCLRSKSAEHAINSVNDCKFISLTLIVYVPTFLILTNLLGYQLSVCTIFIMILGYIPFVSLSWCIYQESCCVIDENKPISGDNNSYAGAFTKKIKLRIQQIRDAKKTRNILINGSWGAGKSHFIEKHLIPTQSLIYISCTDYADTHELVSALITKTNNCLFRWLVRLSISRLLAVLGKYELKEFIGVNKVIVFDEFERLVDYNKIDPMHIVSLIQYLNNQKDCICILVANEDYLNSASQFNNVREKLISYIYRYNIKFDEVLAIIQAEYLQDTKMHLKENLKNNLADKKIIDEIKTIAEYNQKAPELIKRFKLQEVKEIEELVDLNDSNFVNLKQDFQRKYGIDNNIRIMKHLYSKVNQVYSKHKNFDELEGTVSITRDEFLALLFDNVLDLINPLYYLYLKNPYNLKAIETLAVIYRNMKDKPKKEPDKEKQGEQGSSSDNTAKLESYLDKDSFQKLALEYLNENIISYENDGNEFYDVSYDLNYIITNRNFENINAKLITEFLGNEQIVMQLISNNGEYGKTLSQNIKIFMRSFKETFCEDDNSELINNYFKRINVLEQRFVRLIDDTELPWDYSIVTDYIAYCKYIDKTWPRGNPNAIIVGRYRYSDYINALIIRASIEENTTTLNDALIEIQNYSTGFEIQNSSVLKNLILENVKKRVGQLNKITSFIQLIFNIFNKLAKDNSDNEMLILAGIECMHSIYWRMLSIISSGRIITNDTKLTTEQENQIKLINHNMLMIFDLYFRLFPSRRDLERLNWVITKMCDLNRDSQDKFIKSEEFNTLLNIIRDFPDEVLSEFPTQSRKSGSSKHSMFNKITIELESI